MDPSNIISGRFGILRIALLLVLLLISSTAAVVAQAESAENASLESARFLDRRSKMFLRSFRKDAASDEDGVDLEKVGLGLFDAFFASISMIIVSEIGDETFIIAALMAMRHPKSIVLSGALFALIVMTVLSTGLGRIVPNLISRKHTNSAATVLYAFFGLRLLYIAWRSNAKASQKKEMEEVYVYLAGTVMLIFGMGLYGLFISNVPPGLPSDIDRALKGSSLFGMFSLKERPKWMKISSLDELKTKVGHVIVMILLVKMFERSKMVTIATGMDLLSYSVCIFLSSASLYILHNLHKSA